MAVKDVSKWIETLKDVEILWHLEMVQIILKKSVSEVKYPDVETKHGLSKGYLDFIWKDMTIKFFKMYPVEEIVKKNVLGMVLFKMSIF